MMPASSPLTDTLMRGYDLVVIGSSAGGIEALTTLVASLPIAFDASLVIAQHLDPDHVSHLGEILARHTSLPVRIVADQEPLLPGVIYVVPAAQDVVITDHEVALRRHGTTRSIPSVNRLFSSAAQAHGERLIGVILTGAGSDGAAGARDVKAAGGTVIIENPATAAYASMPESLAPSLVDFVVDLPNIGPLLGDLVTGAALPPLVETDSVLPMLLEALHDHSGIDFSTYKPPTILRRLQRRMALMHTASLVAYQHYLADHPEEYDLLAASFLINVTEFFRDREVFVALRDTVLPDLIAQARAHDRAIRIWSAGCSTGEEAYSLAILLADLLGDDLDQVPVRIFATDVNADAIAFARRGRYPATALTGLPEALVAQAFIAADGGFEVVPAIRNLIIFGQHDLGMRAPFSQMDLVLCRNVLIYFTSALQQRTLQLFAFALHDGGYLVLGKAETPASLAAYFAPMLLALKIYRRQGARVVVPPARLTQPPFVSSAPMTTRRPSAVPAAPTPVGGGAATSEYIGALFMQATVGVVVVNRQYDIQAINRAAQHLLGIYRAALGEDLIHLVTTDLALPLRAVIDAVLVHRFPPEEVIVTVAGTEPRSLQVTLIVPPTDAASPPDVLLLQIADVTARVQTQAAAAAHQRTVVTSAPAAPPIPPNRQQRAWADERQQLRDTIVSLTAHLAQMTTQNQTLLDANDAVTTTNQIITGLNEDLVVHNEELQASTEEIKTLNEELQATNEELETLNEELEATVEELHATNEDLQARTNDIQQMALLREEQRHVSDAKAVELAAILHSMSDAVLVVNQAGDTLLTNDAYDTVFGERGLADGLIDEDDQPVPPTALPRQQVVAGRPFHLIFGLVLADGTRHWFEATGEPIVIADMVQGGVITIRDITDRSLRRLQDEFLALASHELRSPLTAILLATQVIEHRLESADERMRPLLETMLRQGHRLQHLINDLTDVTRLQSGRVHLQLAPVAVPALIAQTVAAFQMMTPRPPVIIEATDGLVIQGDAVRMEQILTNLLINASKYAVESPHIIVRAQQMGDEVVIQVQDSGPGIDPTALPHLFQRYYQVQPDAEAAHSGLGLGLFITHELVVAQGGRIAVTSQLGQGTTFTLRFPVLAAAVSIAETKEVDGVGKRAE